MGPRPPPVLVVIPGIRNVAPAEANCAVSDLPAMPGKLATASTATTGAAASGMAEIKFPA